MVKKAGNLESCRMGLGWSQGCSEENWHKGLGCCRQGSREQGYCRLESMGLGLRRPLGHMLGWRSKLQGEGWCWGEGWEGMSLFEVDSVITFESTHATKKARNGMPG